MYQSIYSLIQTYIYSGVELTPDQSLTCTLLSTILCIAYITIPFFVVYCIIKFLFNSISR